MHKGNLARGGLLCVDCARSTRNSLVFSLKTYKSHCAFENDFARSGQMTTITHMLCVDCARSMHNSMSDFYVLLCVWL